MDLYQHRLITEGIRIIEKPSPSNNFNADYNHLSFSDALLKRTQLAELRYQVGPVFLHFQYLIKLFCALMCVVFLCVGASSVSHFLVSEKGSQINFFWAIILFIVPNVISLIVWVFLYFKRYAFNFAWLTNLSVSIIGLLDTFHHKVNTKHPYYTALFRYYFEHRFGKYMGKAQLSFISHLWWSSYLLGATLSLLLVLATHQVDFIWQTTILNEGAFLWLTQTLTYLPELLSINVPSPSDVSHASIGIINPLQAAQDIRVSWSNLLIFSLMIYALLPRIILLLTFYQRIKSKKKHFTIDFSLPYYVQLKSLLHPITNAHFIKDADQQKASEEMKVNNAHYNEALVLPEKMYPFAIELDEKCLKQANSHIKAHYEEPLINILDNQSQQAVLSQLSSSKAENIVIYVDVKRLPDRGWLRLVKQCCYESNVTVYLILLGEQSVDVNSSLSVRLQDWIEIAAQARISTENITYLINNNSLSDDIKNEVEIG
ncbi:DUF2868 domain-containing protein [Psychromonas algarum]|uniref:DUF2868 domain-containing protein n=1 Tax=Psychromonas algarum TaxID=2555643 RepID=UPI001ABBC31C|nr:DUF2868 domain-containing protein [Psychromonas sp. RZ22]